MSDNHHDSGSITRRNMLKIAGAAGVAGISGCSQSGSPTTGGQQDSSSTSGTAFEFWETFNVQSRSAEEFLRQTVSEFEQRTGTTASMNWSGYGPLIGAEWITKFKNGDYPTLFTAPANWNGRFVQGDWIVPFEEYRGELPDETIQAIEWIIPLIEDVDNMWNGIQSVPFALQMIGGMVGRMDHFEQAGLDPNNDFPPDGWEHAIEVGQTLQENGPGRWGYQLWSGSGDQIDGILAPWALADGGENGILLSRDRQEVHFDNDVWIRNTRRFVETYRKYELSSPATPTQVDEKIPQLMASGEVSMSNLESPNHPTMKSQVGELYNSGTIRWAPSWGGDSGQKGYFYPQALSICQKQSNEDQAKYERRRQASIEMIKTFLSKPVQRKLHEVAGVLPVRSDLWEDLPSPPNGVFDSWVEIAESAEFLHQNHPQFVEMMYNIPGPYVKQALNGEISPEEAMNRSAADTRNLLDL